DGERGRAGGGRAQHDLAGAELDGEPRRVDRGAEGDPAQRAVPARVGEQDGVVDPADQQFTRVDPGMEQDADGDPPALAAPVEPRPPARPPRTRKPVADAAPTRTASMP